MKPTPEAMDGDEAFVLFVAAIGAGVAIVRWILLLARARGARSIRVLLAASSIACATGLAIVLRHAAAREVTGDVRYQLLFELLGIAWISAVVGFASWFGISARHDALERHNPAAAVALAGAMVATTLAYGGANVGEGPTIWTTIGPAALATLGLLGAWIAHEFIASAWEAITVDRDAAAGLRLAATLISCGAILGRSVAGDWRSVDDTLGDFARLGWPALALALVAAVVHRVLAPTPSRPRPATLAFGVAPAALFLLAAAIVVRWTS